MMRDGVAGSQAFRRSAKPTRYSMRDGVAAEGSAADQVLIWP